jgi:hypothetical protein
MYINRVLGRIVSNALIRTLAELAISREVRLIGNSNGLDSGLTTMELHRPASGMKKEDVSKQRSILGSVDQIMCFYRSAISTYSPIKTGCHAGRNKNGHSLRLAITVACSSNQHLTRTADSRLVLVLDQCITETCSQFLPTCSYYSGRSPQLMPWLHHYGSRHHPALLLLEPHKSSGAANHLSV